MSHTLFLTGATGYIGYTFASEILHKNGRIEQADITIDKLMLLVRDIEKVKQQYKELLQDTTVEVAFCETSLEELRVDMVTMPLDYIVHCAAVTKSAEMVANSVEVADGIVFGTRNILELARVKQVKSMVYLSSMEVYGRVEEQEELTKEDTLGTIDLLAARSCYPMGKRMAEHYCYAYYKEYGVPVKIARLSQTFGAGVLPSDNRVFAQFAKAAMSGKDIVLHTSGLSVGNYCEIGDTINALWTILVKGNAGEAYNVVNEKNTMRICDMAQLVAEKVAKGNIKVVYEIDSANSHGYAAETKLRLSSEKLRRLGWKPLKGMEEMYCDLIEGLQR